MMFEMIVRLSISIGTACGIQFAQSTIQKRVYRHREGVVWHANVPAALRMRLAWRDDGGFDTGLLECC